MDLDKISAAGYRSPMVKFVRTFVFALLVTFALGSVAQVTSATAMSLKMALDDGGPMEMAGCQGCGSDSGGDEDGLGCDSVCVAPFLGGLSAERSFPALTGASPSARAYYDLVGRTGPPEPYPPRMLI